MRMDVLRSRLMHFIKVAALHLCFNLTGWNASGWIGWHFQNANRGLGLRGQETGRKPRGKVSGRPCCREPCQGRFRSAPLLMSAHFRVAAGWDAPKRRWAKAYFPFLSTPTTLTALPAAVCPCLDLHLCFNTVLLAPPIPPQIKLISVARLQEDPQLCLVL